MTALYKLTEQQLKLKAMAGNSDMPVDAFKDTFEALDGEFRDKAISVIHIVKNINSDIEELDAEIKRLTARKKTITNKQESIREYLRTNMEASEISKIECPLFTITLSKGCDMAVIDNQDSLPDDYIDVEVVQKPNKSAILRALKADPESVPGATLGKSKTSLRIK